MSHQQLSDLAIIFAAVLAIAVVGVLELAVKGWLQRRRTTKRRWKELR